MTSRMGVRARFTLLYGLAMFFTVMLVAGGIYFFAQRALLGQVENHLRKDFATIGEYLRYDLKGLARVADHGPILLFSIMAGDRPLISSDDWQSEELGQAVAAQGRRDGFLSVRAKYERPYRVLVGCIILEGSPYRITVAHDAEPVSQTLHSLALIIMLALPLAVALSLAIGYILAGRVLAPISVIARKAEEISAENLSERLPVGEGDDEFCRLATVFNQTFARIEDSFARLRRFTADASHELRTPLAAIRSIGETALHAHDAQGNCREAIGSILEESDRLRQLIDALLQLSRADAGEIIQRREEVDLTELVRETLEFLGVLAEEKHQTIRLTAESRAIVQVDRANVRQALTNLLDNAIKFSPAASEIGISVGNSADEVFVAIADRGVGIPLEDIPRIFDRFYRVDKGRSREMGGADWGSPSPGGQWKATAAGSKWRASSTEGVFSE